MPLWAIAALLAAGALFGVIEPARSNYAFGTLILYVFLPPLLFEAAWNLDAREILKNWRPIAALAVPGVLLTTAIVAAALKFGGFPWLPALVVGAAVSATDPIAIVAMFKRLPLPAALCTIVQSEALFNDAVAVVVYRSVLLASVAAVSTGSLAAVSAIAIASSLGGIAVGAAIAALIATLTLRRNVAGLQIAATIAGAYGSYFAADAVHASGIFAAIAFGIALRAIERNAISLEAAAGVERFWDAGALFANACVFFLTGAAVHLSRAFDEPYAAVAAIGGVIVSRFVLGYAIAPAAIGTGADHRWFPVIRAAGARGALSLALVLALPFALAFRTQIIDVTFAVVLATLLLSALTVPSAVRTFEKAGSAE